MCKGVPGYLADIESALEGELIQGFHIFKADPEAKSAGLHEVMNQGGKKEGIVRAG
jgi:hypothetical protein